jgi:hypothetical protein
MAEARIVCRWTGRGWAGAEQAHRGMSGEEEKEKMGKMGGGWRIVEGRKEGRKGGREEGKEGRESDPESERVYLRTPNLSESSIFPIIPSSFHLPSSIPAFHGFLQMAGRLTA